MYHALHPCVMKTLVQCNRTANIGLPNTGFLLTLENSLWLASVG
jgi:hypothetical protein